MCHAKRTSWWSETVVSFFFHLKASSKFTWLVLVHSVPFQPPNVHEHPVHKCGTMLRRRQCQDACKLLRLRQSSSTVGVSCFGSRKSGKLGISFIETTMGTLSIDFKTTMKSYAKLAVANIQKCSKASISPMGKSVSLRCSSRSRRRKSSVRSRSYRTLLVDPT